MNIHECVACADDVNKHGDVQIKRVGRLASIDNCQPHSYLWTFILHVLLKICKKHFNFTNPVAYNFKSRNLNVNIYTILVHCRSI